jgi:hypothetical protein
MKIIRVSKFIFFCYTMVIPTELATPIRHPILIFFQEIKME